MNGSALTIATTAWVPSMLAAGWAKYFPQLNLCKTCQMSYLSRRTWCLSLTMALQASSPLCWSSPCPSLRPKSTLWSWFRRTALSNWPLLHWTDFAHNPCIKYKIQILITELKVQDVKDEGQSGKRLALFGLLVWHWISNSCPNLVRLPNWHVSGCHFQEKVGWGTKLSKFSKILQERWFEIKIGHTAERQCVAKKVSFSQYLIYLAHVYFSESLSRLCGWQDGYGEDTGQ